MRISHVDVANAVSTVPVGVGVDPRETRSHPLFESDALLCRKTSGNMVNQTPGRKTSSLDVRLVCLVTISSTLCNAVLNPFSMSFEHFVRSTMQTIRFVAPPLLTTHQTTKVIQPALRRGHILECNSLDDGVCETISSAPSSESMTMWPLGQKVLWQTDTRPDIGTWEQSQQQSNMHSNVATTIAIATTTTIERLKCICP